MTFGECLAPETLARHVRGDLRGEAAEHAREHINQCARCADRAALLSRVRRVGADRIGERLGIEHTSIRIGLLAIRALVAQEHFEEALALARSMAERSVALDARAPGERHLRTAEAMSYLRELAQRRELTVDLVASVETYVDAISERRPFAFHPPVPLTTN